MVQSPSWEANWFAASQEIPRILWNPKFHYRAHNSPPPVPVLGQPNPVHIPTSHLLEIQPNIIHPSTPIFPQWSLSLRFPHRRERDHWGDNLLVQLNIVHLSGVPLHCLLLSTAALPTAGYRFIDYDIWYNYSFLCVMAALLLLWAYLCGRTG